MGDEYHLVCVFVSRSEAVRLPHCMNKKKKKNVNKDGSEDKPTIQYVQLCLQEVKMKSKQINTLCLSLKQLNILDSVYVKDSSAARVKKLFSPCVIIPHKLTTFTMLQINENCNKYHITWHG